MIMETKYTKGEWNVENYDIVSNATSSELPDGGNIICFAPREWDDSMIRWDANAKLIAAAPDLLEALNELVFQLHQFTMGNTGGQDYFKDEMLKARNAIKKATE